MTALTNALKKLEEEPIFRADDVRELFESYELVKDILGDTEKAMIWMNTKNPLLGQLIPMNIIMMFRCHKLLKFIQNCKDENFYEEEE